MSEPQYPAEGVELVCCPTARAKPHNCPFILKVSYKSVSDDSSFKQLYCLSHRTRLKTNTTMM